MVAEVEMIVRSIEDEMIQKAERDRTRDLFARIDGLDGVRQLARPKPSRLLVEERPMLGGAGSPSPPPSSGQGNAVEHSSSSKRLPDILGSSDHIEGQRDLWLVVFNDVVLRCQWVGQTILPIVVETNAQTTSFLHLQGKSEQAATEMRRLYTKPRNLYRFIRVCLLSPSHVVG
jgi:hypothetical protein